MSGGSAQLSLFQKAGADMEAHRPQPPTRVRLSSRAAEVNLHRKRKEALNNLMDVLKGLEGQNVHIGSYFSSGSHFWIDNLKLLRLRVETFKGGDSLPSVVVLWGSRSANVRIFTDQVVNLREQDYMGYTLWLLDFWNGFAEHPIDPYRPRGYVSLDIVKYKD